MVVGGRKKRAPRWWDYWLRNKFFFIALLLQLTLVLYMLQSSTNPPPRKRDRDQALNPHLLFIGIYSERASWTQRSAVRDTWLKFPLPHKISVKYKFIIGKPDCILNGEISQCDQYTRFTEKKIAEENEKYKDILRLDVLEDKEPEISKAVWATFDWLKESLEFMYFLKVQHDSFVRLDLIAEELSRLPVRRPFWNGFVWRNKPPALPRDSGFPLGFNLSKIPAYTDKSTFILSSDIVYELGSSAPTLHFTDEGQSLGFWLLPFNITPTHDKRFLTDDVCHPSMISKAKLSPEAMKDLFSNSVTQDLCRGLDTGRCALCFECQPEQPHWRRTGVQCDAQGVRMTGNDDPLLDTSTENVIGFLPLISCEKRKLGDVQSSGTLVKNGGLKRGAHGLEWELKGSAEIVPKPDVGEDPQNTCVKLSIINVESNTACYITQEIVLPLPGSPEPLVFSAWSKPVALDHAGQGDYSLYADFTYADGSKDFAFTVDFDPAIHDWQYNVRIFNPPKPVVRINIYCMLRLNRGTVYFDDIFVGHLSDQLCSLKHQGLYFSGFRPASLDLGGNAGFLPNSAIIGGRLPRETTRGIAGGRQGLVDDHIHVDGVTLEELHAMANSGPNFFLVWTSPINTFKLRHRRVIESIFFHHPNAHVRVYSNTLPIYFFHIFNSAGYDIQVISYDLKVLVAGVPGANWVDQLDSWQKGEYFYPHVSDLLRFLILYKYGGIYCDTDSILLRPIDFENAVGSEICGSGENYCKGLSDSKLTSQLRYFLPTGFMAFTKEHPLLLKSLSYFDTMYDPSLRHCGSIYLSLAYSQLNVSSSQGLKILPAKSFYPIPESDIVKYFAKDNQPRWKSLSEESYAFHFWGMLTQDSIIMEASLMWRALNAYSISDQEDTTGLQF